MEKTSTRKFILLIAIFLGGALGGGGVLLWAKCTGPKQAVSVPAVAKQGQEDKAARQTGNSAMPKGPSSANRQP